MAMNQTDFAQYIHDEMGFPGDVSDDMKGWAKAIMTELLTNAIVANPPGTITGEAPPSGGPLLNGAGTNGLISDLDGSNLASLISSETGRPINSYLIGFANAITDHIMTLGRVVFESGEIAGACTNTPLSPGVFTGSGSGGEVQDLDGTILANLVKNNVGYPHVSPELETFCTAIITYIMDNAEVTYALCSGTAPSGGGPIAGGTAAAGIIL